MSKSKFEARVKELQKLVYKNEFPWGDKKIIQLQKKINAELYKEINDKVRGTVILEKGNIIWTLSNNIEVIFSYDFYPDEGHVSVYYNCSNKKNCIWETIPNSDEINYIIKYINDDVIWVRKKRMIGFSKPIHIEKEEFNNFSESKKSRYIII